MNINFNYPSINMEISQYTSFDKLFVKIPSLHSVKTELRYATQHLTSHKLYQSAKWAGELLLGVTKQTEIDQAYLLKSFIQNNTDSSHTFDKIYIEKYDKSSDALMIARNLFDLREFKKCAFMLKDFVSNAEYQSAIFLHYFSIYMTGEIRKEEETYENENNSRTAVNTELPLIERMLEKFYKQKQLNELNLYLYALVLKEQEKMEEAKKLFIEVLNLFPCFWSAWLELCKLIESEELDFLLTEIKDHWMKNFFISSFLLEKYKNNNYCLELNYGLICFFKNSSYLINQIAQAFYNSQEFDNSLEWFEKLIDQDPYRYENMDTYSNILYIKENQGELANLALRCFNNNKYTAETCCAVGNYYSLMGEHFKAVVYFRKALKLDRNCLAAWTLMGHEYLEMKNIAGAIDAYRNAVEYDSKDFRAWYGLGQTYELQNMNNYALYYFSRAVSSRPKDSRMWNALGNCFEKMDKKLDATKCYERAESSKDKECIALHLLAKLYHFLGLESKAVKCFEENLRRKDEENVVDKELAECLLFLAKHYKSKKNYEKALIFARRLYDFNGPERDEANTILYEINKHITSFPGNIN